jgi:hypothetical protein
VALFGILGIGLDCKLGTFLDYGLDTINLVDGTGIGTVDGRERRAIERPRDDGVVNASAERDSIRVQAQGRGPGCVIEMARRTDVEIS